MKYVLLALLLPGLAFAASADAPAPATAPITVHVTLQGGGAIGHLDSESRVLGNTTIDVPIPPNPKELFHNDAQQAMLREVGMILARRGLVRPVPETVPAEALLAITVWKTEYYPEKRDYLIDVHVAARMAGRSFDRMYHVSTFESVSQGTRFFQRKAIPARDRAAGLFRDAVVADLAAWFGGAEVPPPPGMRVSLAFERCSKNLLDIIAKQLAGKRGPPSNEDRRMEQYVAILTKGSPWTGKFKPAPNGMNAIAVKVFHAGDRAAAVEFRWGSDRLPPFLVMDLYADGDGTRVELLERDRPGVIKSQASEIIRGYVRLLEPSPSQSAP